MAPLAPELREVRDAREAHEASLARTRAAMTAAVRVARKAGYTNQEIADACGISEAGIRKLLLSST